MPESGTACRRPLVLAGVRQVRGGRVAGGVRKARGARGIGTGNRQPPPARTGDVPGFKGDDWYVIVFTATEFDGELKENGEGFLKWIPDEALESLHLWPSDHIFFQWLREEKFFSAKFMYVGEEMKGYEVTIY